MIKGGAIYFGAVMAILIAHEMGHFLQAKWYKVPATPPFFIPFPISPFGTMGAVIIQGAGVANRKSLFDIAISGPLAGLLLTIPITIIGLHQAGIEPFNANSAEPIYGEPLILRWLIHLIKGPIPAGYELKYDDPWLFAGWVGIFITALNLVPIGQLDGGHILYTLIGRGAHRVAILLLALAVAYMVLQKEISYGLMVVLLFLSGPRHPPTTDDEMPLGVGRIVLGWLTLAFVIVGFTPSPIMIPEVEPHRRQQQQPESSQLYDVRLERLERGATDQFAQRVFMNRSASRESCSSRREHPPPDFGRGGQVRQSQAERFDHHPAVVLDFLEGLERRVPVDVPLAGRAAVVFGNVNVRPCRARTRGSPGRCLFSSMLAWNVSYIIRRLG